MCVYVCVCVCVCGGGGGVARVADKVRKQQSTITEGVKTTSNNLLRSCKNNKQQAWKVRKLQSTTSLEGAETTNSKKLRRCGNYKQQQA